MQFLLFAVILMEGYIVLASELLAIRLVLPWIGTGTDVISIIIAAVLLPLAFGYHFGGTFRKRCREKGLGHMSVRRKLLSNVTRSTLILCVGLSYILLEVFFGALNNLGIEQRLLQLAIYCAVFLVYPVFLLGQTIPLVSHYFSSSALSEMTGKMLSFSTLGSFLGSVFSSVVLMAVVGVHYTAVFVIFLLCVLIFLLAKKRQIAYMATAAGAFVFMLAANSGEQMRSLGIVSNNGYNTVQVFNSSKDEETRLMLLNNNLSSSYKTGEGSIFNYAKLVRKYYLEPIAKAEPKKQILVLGAAGFTLGDFDDHNDYLFVDVDPALQKAAEDHLLLHKLGANKKFAVIDARAYVHQAAERGELYDMIVLDTFKAGFAMPEHLLTREYFQDVKAALKPGGFMIMNSIASAHFEDDYTRRMDNTLRSVFPHLTRTVMPGSGEEFNGWEKTRLGRGMYISNVIYIYRNDPAGDKDMAIYTDDKNTYFLDK
jgi:spermidine synthase